MNHLNKNYWFQFLIFTISSFAMIFLGIRIISYKLLTGENVLAFLILSMILGLISSGLYSMRYKTAGIIFIFSLLIGFYEMYQLFLGSNWDAKGDLAGLILLFSWSIIGLGIGLVAELCLFSFQKYYKAG
ncbi:hypothetical protein [Sinanaerobacter chloroacetimidivorans]|jgi:hypothetical protein|uniref:Uncharacterized protein n=1 Tax=Sinanaerobacter chloroacetimidivorans TaxID=2818044 RepID=A0A8J7W467_9FIRM|nr:hypothetical protein [Sinanaerobacter chloroacetimidivorans]MBR0598890.1 hypothetical protein [Sinanaerobacter chloroacetimidivorans]